MGYSEVTPCVGVWIETSCFSIEMLDNLSHPAWVCGLKPECYTKKGKSTVGHTLRGCVD